MDIALILHKLVPSAKYRGSLTDNTEESYNNIIWEDERPKPSWQDLLDRDTHISKDELLNHLAEYRWKAEVGGINVGGLNIPTDDRSKYMLSGAYNKAIYENDLTLEKTVKIGQGQFIVLSNEQIIQISLAVAQHVQDCFDIEMNVTEKINNDEITTTEQVETEFDNLLIN